jgi:uncharacterized protein
MAGVPRVVVDSNILISAIAFGGKPEDVVRLADRGEIRLYLSPYILDEVRRILLGPKFSVALSDIEDFLDFLRFTTVRRRAPALHVSRDPKDNPILECAVAARADFLVTGDRDLLDLERYEKIRIVTPADFVRQRAEEPPPRGSPRRHRARPRSE